MPVCNPLTNGVTVTATATGNISVGGGGSPTCGQQSLTYPAGSPILGGGPAGPFAYTLQFNVAVTRVIVSFTGGGTSGSNLAEEFIFTSNGNPMVIGLTYNGNTVNCGATVTGNNLELTCAGLSAGAGCGGGIFEITSIDGSGFNTLTISGPGGNGTAFCVIDATPQP